MKIRIEVFVEEQQVPLEEEHDSEDLTAKHFGVFSGDVLVGTGRLMTRGNMGIIGRVAVRREFRGLGLGSGLIRYMVRDARSQAMEEIILGAQIQAQKFYETLGFCVEGPSYLDGGIPHRMMRYRMRCVKEMEK
jgi:predicted GNAT family N-acyltransferase